MIQRGSCCFAVKDEHVKNRDREQSVTRSGPAELKVTQVVLASERHLGAAFITS